MKYIAIISIILLLFIGCDKKKSVAPEIVTHILSGRVSTQVGNPAVGLLVTVDGPYQYSTSTTTDTAGAYNVEASEGATTITFSSTQTVIINLPRYISRDTLLDIKSDTTLNMRVREFTTIFHDAGNRPSSWDMHGGVTWDSTKYVFHDIDNFTDNMMMNAAYTIPDTIEHVGFILYGQAAPSDTSQIIVNAWVNGNVYDGHWTASFSTTPSYYHGSLITVTGLPGHNLQLNLIFNEIDATYIYIRDIWIYCY